MKSLRDDEKDEDGLDKKSVTQPLRDNKSAVEQVDRACRIPYSHKK